MKPKYCIFIAMLPLLLVISGCEKEEIIDAETEEVIDEAVSIYQSDKFQEGYTLVAPLNSTSSYLVDMEGFVVKQWESNFTPGNATYLLEDGSLLRTEKKNLNTTFSGTGGIGGQISRYSFDGDLEWSWDYCTDTHCQHHDIEYLPNGNILVIAWELKGMHEVLDAGKDPDYTNSEGVWPEQILEIVPKGTNEGEVVWEWHQWDHMIQDYDANQAYYGIVADHPELIDINYLDSKNTDMSHANAIEYIEAYDLIVLSVHNYNEIWIIDHSTTTAEAKSHEGGTRGKGGDLVYRWGNPATYDCGTTADQIAYLQHDATWIDDLPSNGGNLLFFNNGNRTDRTWSTVDEVLLPEDGNGNFELLPNVINGPTSVAWRFEQDDFYSNSISGAQRLENGNTLMCEGTDGIFWEVSADQEVVWKYTVPLERGTTFRTTRYTYDYPAFSGESMDRLGINIQ